MLMTWLGSPLAQEPPGLLGMLGTGLTALTDRGVWCPGSLAKLTVKSVGIWVTMRWDWLGSLGLLLYGVTLVALSLRILLKRRPLGGTLAWLLLVYTLPILGVFCYLLLGEPYLGRMRAERAKRQHRFYSLWLEGILSTQRAQPPPRTALGAVMQLTRNSIGMPALSCSQWALYDNADGLFESLKTDIDQAQTAIFLEFYILDDQGRVVNILSALSAAVQRGVRVYLMLDSVGSHRFLRSRRCHRLIRAGVQILEVLYANVLRMSLRRQDLRQHRKLIAIDNRIAYTGSMNLADPAFFNAHLGVGSWVDIMVKIHGDIAKLVQGTLVFDWEMETGVRLEDSLATPTFAERHANLMQLLPSGPALDEEILLQVLLTAIHNAHQRIVLTSPYFVPDESLLQALKSAGKRGLDVTIIVPRKNNSTLAQYAGRSFYQELLLAGVVIRRFTDGLLHTKTVIVDDHLVLIGSVNLDMRSIWLNFEATLLVDDVAFCEQMRTITDDYRRRSDQLLLSDWRQRPLYQRLAENLAQLASPLL